MTSSTDLTMNEKKEALDNLIDEMVLENKCDRLAYLYDRMDEIKKEIGEVTKEYLARVEADAPYLERQGLAIIIGKLKKDYECLNAEFEQIAGIKRQSKGEITQAMIDRAREYPIQNILEVNGRGYALCPFHADKNPSAFTRNNFLYCFSCGENADTIKITMKVKGLNFPEAVKELNR